MPLCSWANASPAMRRYHDREWGKPLHHERRLFELLILEGAQAGLSWSTILNKRRAYHRAFFLLNPHRIIRMTARDQAALLKPPRDPSTVTIVRNRAKIAATIANARAFLAVQKEFGSFNNYLWQFVGGQPRQNAHKSRAHLPAKTPESDAMSKDLLKRGFKFVGSTICYAFMQATGMVNDHTTDCFRHAPLAGKKRPKTT